MKKQILPVLILLLACMILICTGASANSWGLKGKLYQAVEQSKAWDDYTTLSNQEGSFAVMQARYHHALFFVDNAGKSAVKDGIIPRAAAQTAADIITVSVLLHSNSSDHSSSSGSGSL